MTAIPAAAGPPLSPAQARRVFYLLTLTRWFPVGLVVGIFILLATSRGLSTTQALTASAVSGVVCFALELPTSGFADALGRRPVYVVAAVVNVITGFCYLFAHSFWAFATAAALMGVFRALDSGPLEAWFVDTVHESEPGKDVDQELARAGSLLGAAIAAGAVLSGLLIWWHPVRAQPALDLAVWVFALANVAHLVAVLVLLRETPRHDTEATRRANLSRSVRQAPRVVGSGVKLLARNRILLALICAEVCWSVGMIGFESLLPLRLEEVLDSTQRAGALVGPVAAAGWAVFALGSALAGRLSRRIGIARAAMIGRVLNGVGGVIMGLALGPVGLVAAYLFTYSMHGMNGAPHSALLHREAAADNRATVLSMNSMMALLAFAVAGPLVGRLSEVTSLRVAMVTVGAIGTLGVLGYLPARRHERSARALDRDPAASPNANSAG